MRKSMQQHPAGAVYAPTDEVDFVVVGAGSAGGVMARELSQAGFRVVVLEQGPYLRAGDFRHDELGVTQLAALTNDFHKQPNTFRASENEVATKKEVVKYGRAVGGGSVHFTANYWRFHEIDFIERSKVGPVAGADFADWPITYADLEPYYTKVDWEVGVSGLAGANPFDPPRSRGYPLPPLPIKSSGVLAELAAKKMGWHAFPAPMAIISQPYRGRAACVGCGFCETFGCEMNAKSSTLATMIPEAEKTGRCEVRPHSYVHRIETNAAGRATGVTYFDAHGSEVLQRAKAVVLCANGAESPRLLLMSESSRFPNGLANSSGYVGRNLMFNGGAISGGLFEHEINGYKGAVVSRVIQDTFELDPKVGLVGGGGFDFRHDLTPIVFALGGLPTDAPKWGPEYKKMLQEYFTKSVYVFAHATSLPVATNSITLDPALKDAWGLPAIRMTFTEHPNDVKLNEYMQDRAMELLDAAGAKKSWRWNRDPWYPQVHLLGTCRMGNDAKTSVVDKYHRAHDVPNLIIVDGSSFVTSGRGQPTMTIQALAFRAADHAARMAKRGELS
ncbi:MAG TPA: GMC family oxidoreductase [Gemmatimonadaceae bacterium]|nr:GMC family oxidoreductase [Gemmatimonadaceae bacterium]